MISQVENFLLNLEKKDKVINYLKHVYKVEVGEDVEIPEGYIDKLSIKETTNLDGMNIPKEQKLVFDTFEEKVESLNLPDPSDKTAKARIQKLRKLGDTKYLIKYLDLSNYKDKGITKEGLKKVSDGLKMLRSVEVLDLSNNNLEDYFIAEILDFISNDTIKRINLKQNNLTKVSGKKIYQLLKNLKHLEYFDIRYNPMCVDELVSSNICLSLKTHEKLFHLGISDSSRDAAVRCLYLKKNLRSLFIEDNRYKTKTYEYLARTLCDKKIYLAELSLKFSNIDYIAICSLERALKLNRTLISLNLYSCNLSDNSGAKLIEALEFNNVLIDLNLGFNKFGDSFCSVFKEKLRFNKMIKVIDISKNYTISMESFDLIIEGLLNNQSLISLGDLTELKIGVKQKEHTTQILNLNTEFYLKEKRDCELNTSQKENFFKSSLEMENFTQMSLSKQLGEINDKQEFSGFIEHENKGIVENKGNVVKFSNEVDVEVLLQNYCFSFEDSSEENNLFMIPI